MIFPKTVIQRRPRAGESMLWLASKGGKAYNLGKIQTIIADSIEDEILQLVDYAK
jgi:hypothetical protein